LQVEKELEVVPVVASDDEAEPQPLQPKVPSRDSFRDARKNQKRRKRNPEREAERELVRQRRKADVQINICIGSREEGGRGRGEK
jgi:hypothetical protein